MMRDRLMTFGFAALAAVATAGWMRTPTPVQVAPAALTSNFNAPQAATQSLGGDVLGTPETPTFQPAVLTTQPQRTTAKAAAPVYQTVQYRRPVYRDRDARNRTYRDSDYRDYRNEDYRYEGERRSAGKSAAIIAGSAGAGAAIGGMAGGGKGAAIGAIVGGVAGTVYDRSTHKKTDGWGWKR
jgi:hypothetical protein